MRIGLFIPCYIDAFFPDVGIATLELLERFGHDVEYPRDQTCCGQPMANSGFNAEAAGTEALFVRNFSGFDYVVAPSSCVHHARDNFDAIEQTAEVKEVRSRTYELVEFLHDVLKVDAFPWARFPHRVRLHNTCGTLRLLKHATPSELHEPDIVVNLHHAYYRPEFQDRRYASFHTGPSATVDIEGVLIHGAQGVRSLSVLPLPRKKVTD
jgi:L-lactate dehydrogenase complex protein LldE